MEAPPLPATTSTSALPSFSTIATPTASPSTPALSTPSRPTSCNSTSARSPPPSATCVWMESTNGAPRSSSAPPSPSASTSSFVAKPTTCSTTPSSVRPTPPGRPAVSAKSSPRPIVRARSSSARVSRSKTEPPLRRFRQHRLEHVPEDSHDFLQLYVVFSGAPFDRFDLSHQPVSHARHMPQIHEPAHHQNTRSHRALALQHIRQHHRSMLSKYIRPVLRMP